MLPAQAHGPWTGARWPRSLREGRWARRVPPRAPLLGGRRPPLRSGAPRHAPVAPVRPHGPPVKDGSLTASLTQTPACSTARPRLLPRRCGHRGRGALVVGAGPWARIAPGGGSRGRKASKGLRCRCRTASHTAWRPSGIVPAQRSAPIVDARRWPIRAPSCPGVQADDHRIQAARVGAVPPALPAAAPSEPARPRGRPPVPEAPTSEVDGLGRTPASSCWDAPTEPTRPLPQSQVIGQLSGQPAFQGLLERSGEQAISPSDHRPRPNRSARTSRTMPHRNATAPPHPRPPTRATTSSVITYRSFQIKEDTQTNEHAILSHTDTGPASKPQEASAALTRRAWATRSSPMRVGLEAGRRERGSRTAASPSSTARLRNL